MTEAQREQRWRIRYENSVQAMTEHYEFMNERLPVSEYSGINSEQDYKEVMKFTFECRKKEDDSWIKI